jgi:hypothetical protein
MGPDEALKYLVSLLPGAAAHGLLQDVDRGAFGANAKVKLLKQTLEHDLAARRPDHLRRAFTTRLEPFLADTPWLVQSPEKLPGLITRIDAGAVWLTAMTFAMQSDSKAVRSLPNAADIDALPKSRLIEISASFVVNQLKDAFGEVTAKSRWWSIFDGARRAQADSAGIKLGLHPVDDDWFNAVSAALSLGSPYSAPVRFLRDGLDKRGPTDFTTDDGVASLIAATRLSVEANLKERQADSSLADQIPSIALNVSGNYGAIAKYVARRPNSRDGAMTCATLVGHIRGQAHVLSNMSELPDDTGDDPLWTALESAVCAVSDSITLLDPAERIRLQMAMEQLSAVGERAKGGADVVELSMRRLDSTIQGLKERSAGRPGSTHQDTPVRLPPEPVPLLTPTLKKR